MSHVSFNFASSNDDAFAIKHYRLSPPPPTPSDCSHCLKNVSKKQAIFQDKQSPETDHRCVHREKTRKAAEEQKAEDKRNLEETRAREKKAREEARQAEKDRKKAEALEQKKYPMEDLLLLEELQKRAADSGLKLLRIQYKCGTYSVS